MSQYKIIYQEDKARYLQQAPETTRSLYSIIEKYRKGQIQKPRHQREMVWSPSQKQGWIERLNYPLRPVGVIVTYQIKNSPEITYLNDGWQRISTTLEYLDNPNVYGHTEEHARLTVEGCELPQQHRVYNSHEEALQDFQFLNIGTHLTPYEFYRGILAYMDNYSLWQDFFNQLHNIVLPIGRSIIAQASISKVESPTSRATRHKGYRDDYALFIRYFNNETGIRDYTDVSQATPTLNELKSGGVVEEKLKNLLMEKGRSQAIEALQSLKDKIARETRLIEGAAAKVLAPVRKNSTYEVDPGVTITMYRWLLHCSVWRSFNKIQNPEWIDFLERIMDHSGGSSSVISKNNIRYKRVLHSARLGSLAGICDIIGSKIYLGQKSRNKQNRLSPREGCDISHKQPFSVHGDGETILEATSLNRSRGARSIND